jgi:outer membrane beta-barrel protein
MANLSLKDAFYSKYFFGAALMYHPTEDWGFGARFGYAINTVSGTAQICTTTVNAANQEQRTCGMPTMAQLEGRAPGQTKMMGTLDLQWAPLYGKLALVSEAFLHFNLYAVGGPAFIQYQGPPLTVGAASSTYNTVGGHVGAGMRFVMTRWLALRTELRDLIYVERAVSATAPSLFRNQLMFEVGFSLFFPTTFSEN